MCNSYWINVKWVDVRKTTKISVKNSERVSKKRSKSQYTSHQCSKTAKIKVYFQVISELLQRTQLAYRSMAIVMRCDFLFYQRSCIAVCGSWKLQSFSTNYWIHFAACIYFSITAVVEITLRYSKTHKCSSHSAVVSMTWV